MRLRIIVGGFLGLIPGGGVAWDYIQYPLGLAALGHDVFYLEDTAMWPIYEAGEGSAASVVSRLQRIMTRFELEDRWAWRDASERRWHGPAADFAEELIASADVLLNVSCSTFMREAYLRIPVRALIDSDPMFTQMQYELAEGFSPGQTSMRATIDSHTHHFTFGENVNASECRMPSCGVTWVPTRQPICIDWWPVTSPTSSTLTTVMNWSAGRPLRYLNENWGQKDLEFAHIADLPSRVKCSLTLALARTADGLTPMRDLEARGWTVLDAAQVVPDWQSYQEFIMRSGGEFSVAKQTYVKAKTGWFSCRSACYLAAGRPVVAQDTAWSKYYPTGAGLFAFSNEDEAAASLEALGSDPIFHSRAARDIAHSHFASDTVLTALLNRL